MNSIKKALGILWILLGPILVIYLIRTAADEIAKKPVLDTRIEWTVFIIVSIPIATGLILFGYYAARGEYDSGKIDS
jgi:ABC-type polysaccharide/polyol phosphate export permease